MKTTRDIFKGARALVARGWTRGVYHRQHCDEPCYCLVGAIVHVTKQSGPRYEAYATLAKLADTTMDGLVGWNDAPGRTQAEVVDLFDRALAALEPSS